MATVCRRCPLVLAFAAVTIVLLVIVTRGADATPARKINIGPFRPPWHPPIIPTEPMPPSPPPHCPPLMHEIKEKGDTAATATVTAMDSN
jgi:hypothetical protein